MKHIIFILQKKSSLLTFRLLIFLNTFSIPVLIAIFDPHLHSMIVVFRKIANLILMALLLVSTSGMAIYKLQCKCLKHEHISIFIEPESCHNSNSSSCCSSNCHCTELPHQHNDQAPANCDTHEALFVKLAADFLAEDDAVVISPVQTKILDLVFSDFLFKQELNSENTFSDIINSPPPRILSGQKIVTLFHQFKFDQQALLS